MRRGVAVPSERMVLSAAIDPARTASRPADSFADLGQGVATSYALTHDPIQRRGRSPGRAEAIRNLGLIGAEQPAHSPSRRAGSEAAYAQRNGSMAAQLAWDGADPAYTAAPLGERNTADRVHWAEGKTRKGRATTSPRDERASVAYALGIDGLALKAARAQTPPPPPHAARSPAHSTKGDFAPGEMFAHIQQLDSRGNISPGDYDFPYSLRPYSPARARSPRAGREWYGEAPLSARQRAWR
ncbi:hypothetical protein T492DRAFT_1024762 [Pavlovales sp. CCMP2436]|nr:hypothetical protein T492DRAFT_1024762 [Pavlovales sp. CCMP2436]